SVTLPDSRPSFVPSYLTSVRPMSTCTSPDIHRLELQIAQLEQECTDLRATRDKLRQSEAKWRALLDQSIDLITLLTPGGEVVEVNHTALEVVGLTAEQAIGKSWE